MKATSYLDQDGTKVSMIIKSHINDVCNMTHESKVDKAETNQIEFAIIKATQSQVKVEISIGSKKEQAFFEKEDVAERHEYSQSYFMRGYVEVDGEYLEKYQAIAEFEMGSDDFVELTDVELKD